MSVTFDELLRAARAGLIAVTGETAGYLVLAAADGPGGSASTLSPLGTRLSEDGTVVLEPTDAASGLPLRALLGELLGFCRPPPPPLARVAAASGPRLVVEIEAALIPVNRAAGRRALARLHRDVLRAKASGKLDAVSAVSVVAAEPVPLPPGVAAAPVVAAPTLSVQTPAPVVESPAPVARPPAPIAEPLAPVAEPPAPIAEAHTHVPTPALGGVNVFSEAATPIVSIEVEPVVPSSSPRLEAVPQLPSLAVFPYEPEKTPFLGSWPGALSMRTSFRDLTSVPVEHDTERAPPVAFDDPADEGPRAATDEGAQHEPPRPAAIDVEERNQLAEVAEISAPDEWIAVLSQDEPVLPEVRVSSEPVLPEVLAPSEPALPEAAAPSELTFVEVAETSAPDVIDAAAPSEAALPEALETSPPALPEVFEPCEPPTLEAAAPSGPSEEPRDEPADPRPEVAPGPTEASEPPSEAQAAAPAVAADPTPGGPEVLPVAGVDTEAEKAETEPPLVRYQPRKSDVAELLAGFGVAEDRSLREISRELKQIADVAATPAPPRVFVPAARTGLSERAVPGRPR